MFVVFCFRFLVGFYCVLGRVVMFRLDSYFMSCLVLMVCLYWCSRWVVIFLSVFVWVLGCGGIVCSCLLRGWGHCTSAHFLLSWFVCFAGSLCLCAGVWFDLGVLGLFVLFWFFFKSTVWGWCGFTCLLYGRCVYFGEFFLLYSLWWL